MSTVQSKVQREKKIQNSVQYAVIYLFGLRPASARQRFSTFFPICIRARCMAATHTRIHFRAFDVHSECVCSVVFISLYYFVTTNLFLHKLFIKLPQFLSPSSSFPHSRPGRIEHCGRTELKRARAVYQPPFYNAINVYFNRSECQRARVPGAQPLYVYICQWYAISMLSIYLAYRVLCHFIEFNYSFIRMFVMKQVDLWIWYDSVRARACTHIYVQTTALRPPQNPFIHSLAHSFVP